jgi:hypothetical protein
MGSSEADSPRQWSASKPSQGDDDTAEKSANSSARRSMTELSWLGSDHTLPGIT